MFDDIREFVRPLGVGRSLLMLRMGISSGHHKAKSCIYNLILDIAIGRADLILCTYRAFGDTLLLSAVARALMTVRERRVAIATLSADLFQNNPNVFAILNWPEPKCFSLLGKVKRLQFLHYSVQTGIPGRLQSPKEHIIGVMCRNAGIKGKIDLLPRVYLLKNEIRAFHYRKEIIAVQSSIANAGFPILNKEWYAERMQQVVDHLKNSFDCVHLGLKSDPALSGVIDMRGKCGVRETAAILASSRAFVGMVGFLMHLARAVDCPSVIVYGGREQPWQTGYSCNENIYTNIECAPCWREDLCPYERACMQVIGPQEVVGRLEKLLAQSRQLAVDTTVIE